MILTTEKNLMSKASVMANAWASKCDNYRLVTLISKSQANETPRTVLDRVLQPPGLVRDTYDELTDKVMLAFKSIYLDFPDYEWYLKADDDTYVFMDNLRWFLS